MATSPASLSAQPIFGSPKHGRPARHDAPTRDLTRADHRMSCSDQRKPRVMRDFCPVPGTLHHPALPGAGSCAVRIYLARRRFRSTAYHSPGTMRCVALW
jgi:hypothetical protein